MNNYGTGNVLRRVCVIVHSIARALIRGTHAHLGRASVFMGAWFPGVRYPSAVRKLEGRFSEAAYECNP